MSICTSHHTCSVDNLWEINSLLLSLDTLVIKVRLWGLVASALTPCDISLAPSYEFFEPKTLLRDALLPQISWMFSFHNHRGNVYSLQKNQISTDLKIKCHSTLTPSSVDLSCWCLLGAGIYKRCFIKLSYKWLLFCLLWDRLSLCSPDCPQALNPTASASWVLVNRCVPPHPDLPIVL